MTLEEQIDSLRPWYLSCRTWLWYGKDSIHRGIRGIALDPEGDSMIEQAPLIDCLTSPSEYIREYRKWYEENKHVL